MTAGRGAPRGRSSTSPISDKSATIGGPADAERAAGRRPGGAALDERQAGRWRRRAADADSTNGETPRLEGLARLILSKRLARLKAGITPQAQACAHRHCRFGEATSPTPPAFLWRRCAEKWIGTGSYPANRRACRSGEAACRGLAHAAGYGLTSRPAWMPTTMGAAVNGTREALFRVRGQAAGG